MAYTCHTLLSFPRGRLRADLLLYTAASDDSWAGMIAEPVLQVPHLPESLKGLGADGGWRYNATKTRMGQDFFRYMRTALVAVGVITKVDHMSGYGSPIAPSKCIPLHVSRAAALTCLLFMCPTDRPACIWSSSAFQEIAAIASPQTSAAHTLSNVATGLSYLPDPTAVTCNALYICLQASLHCAREEQEGHQVPAPHAGNDLEGPEAAGYLLH